MHLPWRKGKKKKERFLVAGGLDYPLVLGIVVLSAFGLLMLYSSSYYTAQLKYDDSTYFLDKQILFTVASFVAMLVGSYVNYRWLDRKFTWIIYFLAVLLMFLVDFTSFGIELNGSKRWFGIGGHSLFQPTEFVKLAIIMCMAKIFQKLGDTINDFKITIVWVAIISVPAFLVFKNNLSSSIILFGIMLVMLLIGVDKKRTPYWIGLAIIFGAIVVVALFGEFFVDLGILKSYQISRIEVWKDPEAYSTSGGYQVLQGLYAIGSGGFFGKGLGNSTQKLGYVPESQNDMVFSIVVEELGIFGAICLIALYCFLIYRIYKIAKRSPDKYGFFIAAGVAIQIALQVVMNIAVVTNVIPNTGVSLPLVSYGGSSVVFLFAELTLVLSVGRAGNAKIAEDEEKKQQAESGILEMQTPEAEPVNNI